MSVRRSTNTENLVRGADTLLHQGTMLAKAALWAISSGVLVGSVVVSIGASLVTTGTERTFAYKHIAAKTKVFFSQAESFNGCDKKRLRATRRDPSQTTIHTAFDIIFALCFGLVLFGLLSGLF